MLTLFVTLLIGAPARGWSVYPAPPERVSLLSGTAATLLALGLRHPYGEQFQAYESTHRPLGKWSRVGDYAGQVIPNALYVGTEVILAQWGNAAAYGRAELMTVATLEAAAVATALKYTVREQRPNGTDHRSFPSGHSTTIFAFAGVVTAEHGWRYGVPALLLATFTGWSRVNDNMHYLHDVLAGATIGLSFGLGVWARHQSEPRRAFALLPRPLPGGGELLARWAW